MQLYGLLPGEELEELFFQESTWKRWLHFFRRPVTPDTLLMLTTNYLVVIQEDIKVKVGWIVSYIPRSGVCRIQSHGDGLWTEFSVQLQRQEQAASCKFLLAKEAGEEWRNRWLAHSGQWERSSNQGN